MSDKSVKSMIYKGPSMNPTFKTGDILHVLPYNDRKIQRGDVVTFFPPGSKIAFTHRVVHIDPKGIKTLGDNNSEIDKWIIKPDEVIGRVIYARRKNRLIRIYGGLAGCMYAMRIRAVRAVKLSIIALLRPIYHHLSRSGILRIWLPDRMKSQIVSFSKPGGTELQLLMGRRIIGRRLPEKQQWEIKRPFRLFVDEASLPR